MLVLCRKVGESIVFDESVVLVVENIDHHHEGVPKRTKLLADRRVDLRFADIRCTGLPHRAALHIGTDIIVHVDLREVNCVRLAIDASPVIHVRRGELNPHTRAVA